MAARRPEECDLRLFEVIATKDIDAALELYESDATFVVGPETVVTGKAAIREVLEGMMAGNATGRLEAVTVVESADGTIAFTRAQGSSTAAGPDGASVTTQFHSIEVVRKQPDGTWRIVIDDPSAAGLASGKPKP
jgi:uncharacterized protein (TIGR02246 family)